MSSTLFIIFAILTGLLFGLSLIVLFVCFLYKIMFNNKEMTRLIQAYRTKDQPEGLVLVKQTIGLSRILRYRKCVTVCISPQGFYLLINGYWRRKPKVLIPWDQINNVERARLYGVDAFALLVGQFPYIIIRVYPPLFSKMSPYLKKGVEL